MFSGRLGANLLRKRGKNVQHVWWVKLSISQWMVLATKSIQPIRAPLLITQRNHWIDVLHFQLILLNSNQVKEDLTFRVSRSICPQLSPTSLFEPLQSAPWGCRMHWTASCRERAVSHNWKRRDGGKEDFFNFLHFLPRSKEKEKKRRTCPKN